MKKYGILLSPEEHKQLKRLAADTGGTMQDIARDAVLSAMRRGGISVAESTNRQSDEGVLSLLLVVREDLNRLVRLIDNRGEKADARNHSPDAAEVERTRARLTGLSRAVDPGANAGARGSTENHSSNKKRPANRR